MLEFWETPNRKVHAVKASELPNLVHKTKKKKVTFDGLISTRCLEANTMRNVLPVSNRRSNKSWKL